MDNPPPPPPKEQDPYQTPEHFDAPPAPQAPSGTDLTSRLLLPVGRSGWAIAAGYLGLFAMLIIPAPIAVIVSVIAIRDIKKSQTAEVQKHGMGRAIFGLIMGFIFSLVFVGAIIFTVMNRQMN